MGLRIGIDVGGTFTDAVAIDAASGALVGAVKVPTSHTASDGVAAGIVEALKRLLLDNALDPAAIGFIAHSTTQATNAMLEGDVADVAVVGLARGPAAMFARGQMRFRPIALSANAHFAPRFAFARDAGAACAAVDALAAGGATAFAISEPFAVDVPGDEDRVVAYARERRLAATSGHEVSEMYGLRARTRTAAINAAILPRMLQTARTTANAVRDAGITAPLMIMRSDGGVMNVAEVERRPILTLLSGPAAGIAGALLHENVTDGIFIEVGGTSSDCSAICGGLPQMRAGRVGGVKTLLRTLDVRSIGVGGGSLVHLDGNRVVDVGPRSAHIAGYGYTCYSPELIEGATFSPATVDGAQIALLRARDGTLLALTPTCAANALGLVPAGAWAFADPRAARAAFEIAAVALGTTADAFARGVLDCAAEKLDAVIEELATDYALDRATLVVVGGGGGAGALVPHAAQRGRVEMRLAKNAEVISPIGVALALVREVVERTMPDPSPDDIIVLRRQARERVIAAGADAETVDVTVEVDRRQNLVRATASGASAFSGQASAGDASETERRNAVARRLRVEPDAVEQIVALGSLAVYRAAQTMRGMFGRRTAVEYIALCDRRAVVRLVLRGAVCTVATARTARTALRRALEEATSYGDVGRKLPAAYLAYEGRFVDLSGVATIDQAAGIAAEELQGLAPEVAVAIVTA